jgi:hypothetical protein
LWVTASRFEGLLVGSFAFKGSDAFSLSGDTEARVAGDQVQMDFDGDGVADLAITLTGLSDPTEINASNFEFW